jgi:hypothetical protein
MLEERVIDELQVLLRKHVVFESSCLANQQYDINMTFKLLEDMSKDRDLLSFIEVNRTDFSSVDVDALLVSLSVATTPLPSPPPRLVAPSPVSPRQDTDWPVVAPGDLWRLAGEPAASRVVPSSTILRLLLAYRGPDASPGRESLTGGVLPQVRSSLFPEKGSTLCAY